jgi:hypothetical protein
MAARGLCSDDRRALALAAALFLIGCATSRPSSAPSPPVVATTPRLDLDPSVSPVEFRWIGDDVVLVAPDVGNRKLAAFGNYVERAAKNRERVRLAVWDDEAAWKTAHQTASDSEGLLAHKRALFVKNVAASPPVDHYTTFGPDGEIVYERDFRTYPLSELDDE